MKYNTEKELRLKLYKWANENITSEDIDIATGGLGSEMSIESIVMGVINYLKDIFNIDLSDLKNLDLFKIFSDEASSPESKASMLGALVFGNQGTDDDFDDSDLDFDIDISGTYREDAGNSNEYDSDSEEYNFDGDDFKGDDFEEDQHLGESMGWARNDTEAKRRFSKEKNRKKKYGIPVFQERFDRNHYKEFQRALLGQEGGRCTSANDYGAYGPFQIMWYNAFKWAKKHTGVDYYQKLSEEQKKRYDEIYELKKKHSADDLRDKSKFKPAPGSKLNVNQEAVEILKSTGVYNCKLQYTIAEKELHKYFDKSGDWAVVGAMWYCGPHKVHHKLDNAANCKSGDPKYPDGDKYMRSVMKKMQSYLPKSNDLTDDSLIKGSSFDYNIRRRALQVLIKKSNFLDLNGDFETANKIDKFLIQLKNK